MDLEMCRICGGVQHLKKIVVEDAEMMNKLLLCANINMTSGDLLPKLICVQCDKNLDLCYSLRKQSEATQKRLRLEIQKKQKANDNWVPEVIKTNEQIDLSQDSENSIDCTIHRKCSEEASSASYKTYEDKEIEFNQDKFKCETLHQEIADKKEEHFEQIGMLIETPEVDDVGHIESTELSSTFDDFFTSSCFNTLKEVTEVPIISEYCSIDLLSSPESSTNECGLLINDQVKTNDDLTCGTCHAVFTDKNEYRLHIKEHGLDRYQCIQCCKFFPSSFRLKRHEEIHSEMPFHQCPHCNRSYRAAYNLKRHIKSAHLGKKTWECKLCNFSFSRVDVLKRHLQLHSDEKKFDCSKCSQSFKTRDYLYAHHKTHHPDLSKSKKQIKKDNVSKNQCGYCGKMFKSLFTYKNHLLIHTNEKPYKCDACNKSFRTIAALTTHQRIHDDYRPYQCDLCLKSFRQTSHLKDHRLLHLENVPKHVCSICEASFAKKSNLKAHMRIHTNEKPFKCADCSSEFSFMHLLQRHASKVHYRSAHKVYTINDGDIDGVDNGISNTDNVESEAYHYISTMEDDDDEAEKKASHFVDFFEDTQSILEAPSSHELELSAKREVNQHIFYDKICASSESVPVVNADEIHSLNFTRPQPSDEDFVQQINDCENNIKEQKIDIFVTEETKLTIPGYNDYKMK